MRIENVEFSVSLEEILNELVKEMRANNVAYIQKMKPTSTHIQICCPYHNQGMENRPSAGIRRSDGMFHCFACSEVHTLPEVVSHCFGRDDGGLFGFNWLIKNFASVSVEDRGEINLDYTRNLPNAEKTKFVSEGELDKYRYTHPYMYKRRLTDEIIELFDVGYDSDSDSITFPVRDINGNTLFIARRAVHTKRFHYPQGVEKPVYGLYEIIKFYDSFSKDHSNAQCLDFDFDTDSTRPIGVNFPQEIIICESIIDALTCWVYGKPAVALNGLGTDAQFADLSRFPCRKYILATDMDEAGLKARKRIKNGIKNKVVTEYIWDINVAKDINDMEKPYFDSLAEYF